MFNIFNFTLMAYSANFFVEVLKDPLPWKYQQGFKLNEELFNLAE
jgi:hypothetical protein